MRERGCACVRNSLVPFLLDRTISSPPHVELTNLVPRATQSKKDDVEDRKGEEANSESYCDDRQRGTPKVREEAGDEPARPASCARRVVSPQSGDGRGSPLALRRSR